jgi:hypothetical protein
MFAYWADVHYDRPSDVHHFSQKPLINCLTVVPLMFYLFIMKKILPLLKTLMFTRFISIFCLLLTVQLLEVVVRFVDIGGIVDHLCLNFFL